MQEMSTEFIDEFEGIENRATFFTPAEKSLLVYSCIIGITTKAVSLALFSNSQIDIKCVHT